MYLMLYEKKCVYIQGGGVSKGKSKRMWQCDSIFFIIFTLKIVRKYAYVWEIP